MRSCNTKLISRSHSTSLSMSDFDDSVATPPSSPNIIGGDEHEIQDGGYNHNQAELFSKIGSKAEAIMNLATSSLEEIFNSQTKKTNSSGQNDRQLYKKLEERCNGLEESFWAQKLEIERLKDIVREWVSKEKDEMSKYAHSSTYLVQNGVPLPDDEFDLRSAEDSSPDSSPCSKGHSIYPYETYGANRIKPLESAVRNTIVGYGDCCGPGTRPGEISKRHDGTTNKRPRTC
ncbi:hypothetical protein F5884DRAFT_757599 [Xylogone sp. PMI_703]|nr:hypothetical protein F5884DRAFT_757599 [Xylogone sp. PMI_703]